MKRYSLLLFILVLFGLASCNDFLGSNASDSLVSYDVVTFQRQDENCTEVADNSDNGKVCAEVDISYPIIDSTPVPDMRKQLNSKIEKIVLASVGEDTDQSSNLDQLAYRFFQEYKKDGDARSMPWFLKKHIGVLLNTPQLISFNIESSGYAGGAHGYHIVQFMNIDLDIMQELKLADFLLAGYEAELNVTGEKVFRKVRELPLDFDLDKAGFWFENNQFALNDNYAITDKGLVFYFNSYDIASYADGPTEILIPYTDIQNLIDPNGALAPFLNGKTQ